MNLRQLEVFYAVMKAGSVTVAARNLNVSQPAISAVLKHTEATMRMKLFERIGGRLHPTPEALSLLPDVQDIFGRVETLKRTVADMRDAERGNLVIATSPTLVNTILPGVVAKFRQANPAVDVFMHSLPTQFAVDRVVRRDADLGVVYGPLKDAGVTIERIAASEIVCAMRADNPLAGKRYVDAKSLGSIPLISLGPTTRLGAMIDDACKALSMPALHVNIEASSSFTACLLVAEGAGVALIDRFTMLSPRLTDIVVKPFRPKIEVQLCLIYPLNRKRRSAVRFGELLRDAARTRP